MDLIEELVNEFLFQHDEISSVLNRVTGELLMDAPESVTGEPEIDWEDEAASNLIPIPQISSAESFEIMVLFAKKQEPTISNELKEILGGRKPFRNFKDKVQVLNIENSWYRFEQEYAEKRIMEWLEVKKVPGTQTIEPPAFQLSRI